MDSRKFNVLRHFLNKILLGQSGGYDSIDEYFEENKTILM